MVFAGRANVKGAEVRKKALWVRGICILVSGTNKLSDVCFSIPRPGGLDVRDCEEMSRNNKYICICSVFKQEAIVAHVLRRQI